MIRTAKDYFDFKQQTYDSLIRTMLFIAMYYGLNRITGETGRLLDLMQYGIVTFVMAALVINSGLIDDFLKQSGTDYDEMSEDELGEVGFVVSFFKTLLYLGFWLSFIGFMVLFITRFIRMLGLI